MCFCVVNIMFHAFTHAGDGIVIQIAHIFGGTAAPKLTVKDALTRRQHSAGGQHRVTLYYAAIHDDRSQSDERAVLQRATMQHGHVADQHVFPNDSGKAPRAVLVAIAMDDGAVLDIGASADADMIHIRADDAIIPDARSEEHTSELQSLMRISYAVFCLKNKQNTYIFNYYQHTTVQNIHKSVTYTLH